MPRKAPSHGTVQPESWSHARHPAQSAFQARCQLRAGLTWILFIPCLQGPEAVGIALVLTDDRARLWVMPALCLLVSDPSAHQAEIITLPGPSREASCSTATRREKNWENSHDARALATPFGLGRRVIVFHSSSCSHSSHISICICFHNFLSSIWLTKILNYPTILGRSSLFFACQMKLYL